MISPLISDALKAGASKIFFEPGESFMSVRYRVDGYLKEQSRFPIEMAARLTDYFSSKSKGGEDKHFFRQYETKIEINDKKTGVLVNILAANYGDSVSLSVINELAEPRDISELGFEPETLSVYKKNIEIPNGLILITGTAGSGKSLTMYSTMKALNYPDRKIISFGRNLEYSVNGVTQICQPSESRLDKYSFSKIIDRHEPDIIFIEDILEGNNAEIVIDAAMTGHTVFSTMNASSALDAITKLLLNGISPSLLASCLVMISNQRLMRLICGDCKESYDLPVSMLKPLGYEPNDPNEAEIKLKKSSGCQQCNNTGYKSRTAVYEIFEPDEKMKTLIASKHTESSMKEHYLQKKSMTIAEGALRKVVSGLSSVEEFLRLTKIS